MIRNKPDSYSQAHDVETKGISLLVQDLIDGALAGSRFRIGLRTRRIWNGFLRIFGIRR
jgi:hypothetical protein